METRIGGTIFGYSYIAYNIWRRICRVKCMKTQVEGSMYGDSHREYNVCRLI